MPEGLTTAIKEILADERCEMNAELVNQLHGCCSSHPFAKGKSAEERKLDALAAVAQAKHVPANLRFKLEGADTCTS